MRVVSSWSGGKDSCLACYKAMKAGHEICFLVNFISKEQKKCCFHGTNAALLQAQSDSIGIPIVQIEVSQDMKNYEAGFKSAVIGLRDKYGIEGMVFGDIYLDEHKDWVERVCRDMNIAMIEPLWAMPAEEVISKFIENFSVSDKKARQKD